jgi:spermidine/putrescine transport system ATP-binding protein
MIGIDGVWKVFGAGDSAVAALRDINLTIPDGSFFTLLGPSGCGKTTLLRLIAGFELPTAGGITLDGLDVGHLPPHHRPVNTVFQNYALFPHLNVAQNVGFGLEMLGRDKAEIAQTTAEMLELVRMSQFADRRVDQLSGGQQQRVALARALAPRPKVLLLDEPLSALDLKLRKEMQEELKRLQMETGLTFVFVTHDQGEALAMSDQIAVMSAGEVQQVGTPQEIYQRPKSCFVADFIGDTNIVCAEMIGRANDASMIRFAGADGVFSAGGFMPNHATGSVQVAVHPESLSIVDAGDPAAALIGAVEQNTYQGATTRVQVRLDQGELVTTDVASALAIGSRVGLTCGGAGFHVLED